MRMPNPWLLAGGAGSAVASLLHFACIAVGAPMYRWMGAGEAMARMAARGEWTPHLLTFGIALVLAIWAAYGWSAAGLIGRLPLCRPALVAIAAVYLLRGAVLFAPGLLRRPDLSDAFLCWSSLAALVLGSCYAIGAWRGWSDVGAMR